MVYQELSKLFAKEKPDVAQILSALLGAAGAKADAYYDTEKRKEKSLVLQGAIMEELLV